MQDLQERIKKFSEARGWTDKKLFNTYNMIGNISEEIGEVWNVIKWIDKEDDFEKVISSSRKELKDGIGDLLWCIARLANTFDIDMNESLQATLAEYEGRFPTDRVKGKHGNRKLGGFDGKYDV